MAKKSTAKSGTGKSRSGGKAKSQKAKSSGRAREDFGAGEAFIKLLQSPLVADLVAVAATAALASLAEHGFTSRSGTGSSRGKRAGKAVKEAGKAAASAIGRRL